MNNKFQQLLFERIDKNKDYVKNSFKKKEVVVFFWIPGSWKSYISNKLSKEKWYIILSTDKLKLLFLKNKLTYTTSDIFKLRDMIFSYLLYNNLSIILDSNIWTKDNFIKLLNKIPTKNVYNLVIYYFVPNIYLSYYRILIRSIKNLLLYRKICCNSLNTLKRYKEELIEYKDLLNVIEKVKSNSGFSIILYKT